MTTPREKSLALAQAIASLRRAAQDVASATRELSTLTESERASLLTAVSKDLRELQTQVNAEVGAILVSAVTAEGASSNGGENVYARIRRDVKERVDAKKDREQRARELGEGLQ
jgi:hypothetical protein